MKLLYIGYYREPTIWGQQCVDTARALGEITEFDVVIRSLEMRPNGSTPSSIVGLEYKPVEGALVCYQQVLDHHYVDSKGIFKYTKHLTDNLNIIHPDVLRQKYEPLNVDAATGYKYYTITNGSRGERIKLDNVYDNFKRDFNPSSNATFTIFTTNPEAVQKDVAEITETNRTINTIIVPIESTDVPLPQIHNWGDEYICITPMTGKEPFLRGEAEAYSCNFGYHAQMAEFFGRKSSASVLGSVSFVGAGHSFSEWEENPVAYDLAWRQRGMKNCADWWERNKKYLTEGVLDAQN